MSEQDTGLPPRRGRAWWVFGVVLVVAALAAALLMYRRESASPAAALPNDASAFARAGGEPSVPEPGVASVAASPLRDSEGDEPVPPPTSRGTQRQPPLTAASEPAASAIATLLPLAESGRADAMAELAQRLMACRNYVGRDEASIRRGALQRFYRRRGYEPGSDAELTQIAGDIERETAMADRCRDIDPALMDSRIDWMERAAKAGDIGAMLDYPGYALHDMRTVDDVLMNFEEVGRRRQLAGELLRGALDRGACEALPMLAQAYSGGRNRYDWLFKADPYLGLVYAEAAAQAGVTDGGLARARERLIDPARQGAAATQGAALAARHCGTAG